MIYKQFQDLQLSALGMGCMRLPCINGNDAEIDIAQTEKMVEYAIEHGVNYFDTAWGYHAGNSETIIGSCLQKISAQSFLPSFQISGIRSFQYAKSGRNF